MPSKCERGVVELSPVSEGESGVPLLEKPQSVEVCNQESNCSDVWPLKVWHLLIENIEVQEMIIIQCVEKFS